VSPALIYAAGVLIATMFNVEDGPDPDLVYAYYLRTCATHKSGLSSAAAAHVRLKGACLRAS
jgi:hypothetical protein